MTLLPEQQGRNYFNSAQGTCQIKEFNPLEQNKAAWVP